jgi:hypothetical protein
MIMLDGAAADVDESRRFLSQRHFMRAALQLTGDGLVPFAADKAAAFSHAVYHAFGNNTSIFSLNVSDYTTIRLPTGNRCCLLCSMCLHAYARCWDAATP